MDSLVSTSKTRRKPSRQHSSRLDFRLSDEAKARIEKAALISGQSLSDFAASTLVREANEVLANHEVTTLSDRDRDLFLALLDAPDAPNDNLKTAFARYQQGEVVGSRYVLPSETPKGEL